MSNELYIKNCVEQFETLLKEQYARAEKMKNAPAAIDYATLDKIVIGCCGGDGIGPIITAEARRVLEFLLKDAVASGKVELRETEEFVFNFCEYGLSAADTKTTITITDDCQRVRDHNTWEANLRIDCILLIPVTDEEENENED